MSSFRQETINCAVTYFKVFMCYIFFVYEAFQGVKATSDASLNLGDTGIFNQRQAVHDYGIEECDSDTINVKKMIATLTVVYLKSQNLVKSDESANKAL